MEKIGNVDSEIVKKLEIYKENFPFYQKPMIQIIISTNLVLCIIFIFNKHTSICKTTLMTKLVTVLDLLAFGEPLPLYIAAHYAGNQS